MAENRPMDKVSVERAKLMHPKLVDETLKILQEMTNALAGKALPRLAYTFRSLAEQDALYAQGRTKKFDNSGNRLGIVTNAKGGQSYHNYGLAYDIVLLLDKDANGTYESASWDTKADHDKDKQPDWMECVKIAKAHGWEWGGDFQGNFKDMPHFQKSFGLKYPALAAKKKDAKGYPIL